MAGRDSLKARRPGDNQGQPRLRAAVPIGLLVAASLQACYRGGAPPVIDLWYGSRQTFGASGVPQRWANVLGRVSPASSIESLGYSLNGGPERPLPMGPDARRLEAPGDFNIEIDFKDLAVGANQLTITARGRHGRRTARTITLDYAPRPVPLADYFIDWSTVRCIGEVAQVVDGRWMLTTDGVRSAEPGYDRIIAIGDITWTDYEVSMPVTVHSMDPRFANPAGGAAVGVLVRWSGHVAWGERRPREGWWPLGAAGWYGWENDLPAPHLMLHGNRGRLLSHLGTGKRLETGRSYLFKVRASTRPRTGHRYAFKAWARGEAEPPAWDLSGVEGADEPSAGSVLLITHYVDATFGNVHIRPLRRHDVAR